MKHPQQGAQNVQGGAAQGAAPLPRLAVQAVPGAAVGGNAGLGVAVQRHSAAGAEHLLAAAAPHDCTSAGRWSR